MSTNSLFELLTVYTDVPESVFATSAAPSARSKACFGCGIEAEREGGGVEREAKEAEAVRRPWSRRAENWERWWWTKEEMAAMGLGGDEVAETEMEAEAEAEEEEEEEAIGAAESGREGEAPVISLLVLSHCCHFFHLLSLGCFVGPPVSDPMRPMAHGLWALLRIR